MIKFKKMEGTANINTDILSCTCCLELPPTEVYHCTNGHVTCARCIARLHNCCRCQVEFDPKIQRNKVAESILDGLSLPCKNAGCFEIMDRASLAAHREKCSFRPIRLCSVFGYPTCQKEMATGEEFRKHMMESHHERVKTIGTKNKMCWPGLPTKYMKTIRPWNFFWSAGEGQEPMFMTHSKMSSNSNGDVTLSAIIIYLGESSKTSDSYAGTLKLSMIYEGQTKCVFTWTGALVHFKSAEDQSSIPYFSTPINYFKNKMDGSGKEFTLVLEFFVELQAEKKK